MSDPYPEVGDESGIVPPQSLRNPDWPKKIRTLTAAELDRLTIDGSGRFYWDGKLVNYEPPQLRSSEHPDGKRAMPLDPAALEILDRAAQELGDSRAHDDATGDSRRSRGADLSVVDLDGQRAADTAADAGSEDRVAVAAVAPRFHVPERVRVKLSGWQSIGAIIAVLGIAAGASGIAAYGFVVAHEWGCRTHLVQSYCPAPPVVRPARPDIPA